MNNKQNQEFTKIEQYMYSKHFLSIRKVGTTLTECFNQFVSHMLCKVD